MTKFIIIIMAFFGLHHSMASASSTEQKILDAILRDTSGVVYHEIPSQVKTSFSNLFSVAAGSISNLPLSTFEPIINFIKKNYKNGKAWKISGMKDASGAALTTVFTNSIQEKLNFTYNAKIPDYVIYPGSIRYSNALIDDYKNYDYVVDTPAEKNQIKVISFPTAEYNTPNLQSGAYYCYTNTKTLVRVNLDNQDLMISMSASIQASSFSQKGVPVGNPDDNIYFYTGKEGLTLMGLSWVKSRIYFSRSAVVHLALDSNTVACATFSWLSAGWGDINPTRSFHIYTILADIADYQHRVMDYNINFKDITNAIAKVDKMSKQDIEKQYEKYCDYVKRYATKGEGQLFPYRRATKIASYYDTNALKNLKFKFKKAIVEQEMVRVSFGTPTWSTQNN